MIRTKSTMLSTATIVCGALLAVSYLNCSDLGTNPNCANATLDVTTVQPGISLTNNTCDRVYYIVAEWRTSELIDWIGGCTGQTYVNAGRAKLVPYSDVLGYYKGCEIWLAWWKCPAVALGNSQPGAFHAMHFTSP